MFPFFLRGIPTKTSPFLPPPRFSSLRKGDAPSLFFRRPSFHPPFFFHCPPRTLPCEAELRNPFSFSWQWISFFSPLPFPQFFPPTSVLFAMEHRCRSVDVSLSPFFFKRRSIHLFSFFFPPFSSFQRANPPLSWRWRIAYLPFPFLLAKISPFL